MSRNYNYQSVLCEYCPYTEYGLYSCEINTPNGYTSCEGCCCDEAYDNYVDDTGDNTPLDDLF